MAWCGFCLRSNCIVHGRSPRTTLTIACDAMRTLDKKVYLASKSPRRRELLRQVGVEFELLMLRNDGPRGADVTEEVIPNESPLDYVARVADEKAAFAWNIVQQRRLVQR